MESIRRMDDGQVAALARRLAGVEVPHLASGVADWSRDGVRAVVERLGLRWTDSAQGPVGLGDGSSFSARPIPLADPPPAETLPSRYRGVAPEFSGLAVALASAAEGHEARGFRRIAEAVDGVLGPADCLGTYGAAGVLDRPAGAPWGTPYMRWGTGATAVELRAMPDRLELAVQDNFLWRAWYNERDYFYEYLNVELTGFLGVRQDVEQELGLKHPGGRILHHWDDLRDALTVFMTLLPAETIALGVPMSAPLFCRMRHNDSWTGPVSLFHLYCEDRLYVSYYGDGFHDASVTVYDDVGEGARGANVAALGWTQAPLSADGNPKWRIDAGGPGAVRAAEAADLIVRTAQAAGAPFENDVMLGAEATVLCPLRSRLASVGVPAYRFTFPGLGMHVV